MSIDDVLPLRSWDTLCAYNHVRGSLKRKRVLAIAPHTRIDTMRRAIRFVVVNESSHCRLKLECHGGCLQRFRKAHGPISRRLCEDALRDDGPFFDLPCSACLRLQVLVGARERVLLPLPGDDAAMRVPRRVRGGGAFERSYTGQKAVRM